MHDKTEKRLRLAARGFRATTSELASPTHRPQQATDVRRERQLQQPRRVSIAHVRARVRPPTPGRVPRDGGRKYGEITQQAQSGTRLQTRKKRALTRRLMHLRKRDLASSKKSDRIGEIQGDESADVDGAHGPWRREPSLSSESASGERIFSRSLFVSP